MFVKLNKDIMINLNHISIFQKHTEYDKAEQYRIRFFESKKDGTPYSVSFNTEQNRDKAFQILEKGLKKEGLINIS